MRRSRPSAPCRITGLARFAAGVLLAVLACEGGGTGDGAGGNFATGGKGTGGGASGGAASGGKAGVGSGGGGTATGGEGEPVPPASWATVKTVIGTCSGSDCHARGENQPTLIGPGLTDAQLHDTLTTFKSSMCGNRVLVVPRAPTDSAFLRAQAGQCAPLERMPKGCSSDTCTPPNYLEAIRAWIMAGAPLE